MKKRIDSFPKRYILDFGEPMLQTATKYVERFLDLGEIPEIGFWNQNNYEDLYDTYAIHPDMFGYCYNETPASDVLASELERSDMTFFATVATDVSDQHRIQLFGFPKVLRQKMNGIMIISCFDSEGEKFVENYLSLIGSKEENV